MSLETDLYAALQGFVGGRVFPDVAEIATPRPYITYQKVGGQAWNYLESTFVGARHARVQMNYWDATRIGVAALARQCEVALVQSTTLRAFVETPAMDLYNEDLDLYGAMQDFSFRY